MNTHIHSSVKVILWVLPCVYDFPSILDHSVSMSKDGPTTGLNVVKVGEKVLSNFG